MADCFSITSRIYHHPETTHLLAVLLLVQHRSLRSQHHLAELEAPIRVPDAKLDLLLRVIHQKDDNRSLRSLRVENHNVLEHVETEQRTVDGLDGRLRVRRQRPHQRETRRVDDRLHVPPFLHAHIHVSPMVLLERENHLAQIVLEGEGDVSLVALPLPLPSWIRRVVLQQPLEVVRQTVQRRPLATTPARFHLPVEELSALCPRGVGPRLHVENVRPQSAALQTAVVGAAHLLRDVFRFSRRDEQLPVLLRRHVPLRLHLEVARLLEERALSMDALQQRFDALRHHRTLQLEVEHQQRVQLVALQRRVVRCHVPLLLLRGAASLHELRLALSTAHRPSSLSPQRVLELTEQLRHANHLRPVDKSDEPSQHLAAPRLLLLLVARHLILQSPRLERVERRQDLAAAVLVLVVAEHVAGFQRGVEEGRQQTEEGDFSDGNEESRRGRVLVLLRSLLLVVVLQREDDEVGKQVRRLVCAGGIQQGLEDVENGVAGLRHAFGARNRRTGGGGVRSPTVDAACVGSRERRRLRGTEQQESHGELGHPLGVVLAGDALEAAAALGALLVASERVLGAPVL